MMMSGGVDSSVGASVLLEQGHEVIGVFMKCWSVEQLESLGASDDLYGCFWEEDSNDARLVANKLNIPFYVWDFEKEYKKGVVDYMLNEYKSGRTPNPDVMCNSIIKFGIFYKQAMSLGADFVATGHYAKIVNDSNKFSILRGNDLNKDQSYFLWKIQREQLSRTLFPIGEFSAKSEVRKFAEFRDLITANKPDSQGLCFIGQTPLRELLLQTLGKSEGDILDESGNFLGKHPGAFLFTIGQRNGLGLSGGPWFVSKTDIEKNLVFVSHQGKEQSLYGKFLIAKEPNWQIDISDLGSDFQCQAQIRYRQEPTNCRVKIHKDEILVEFDDEIRAISPGQSIVFYIDKEMLGGAVIHSKTNINYT